MRLTDLIETFKGHDKVIFKLTGIGEMEYNTVEFKDAIDTIEALQQENNGWQERYYELDAGHSRLFKDFCKLQKENEQLQAQVTRVREALRKARETLAECIDALELCTHSELCKIVISPYDMINDAKQTLAAIDKVIGGLSHEGE